MVYCENGTVRGQPRFNVIAGNETIEQTPEERILLASIDEEFVYALANFLFSQSVHLVTPTPESQQDVEESVDEMRRIAPIIMQRFSLTSKQYRELVVFKTREFSLQ